VKKRLGDIRCLISVFLLMLLASGSFAQPPAGYEWPDRAYDYASYWWNSYNPDYGYWDVNLDCANFQSQVGQAGCAGLCEDNDTNNYPPYYWTSRADCPSYYWNGHSWKPSLLA
jgi:hypothetical protein